MLPKPRSLVKLKRTKQSDFQLVSVGVCRVLQVSNRLLSVFLRGFYMVSTSLQLCFVMVPVVALALLVVVLMFSSLAVLVVSVVALPILSRPQENHENHLQDRQNHRQDHQKAKLSG